MEHIHEYNFIHLSHEEKVAVVGECGVRLGRGGKRCRKANRLRAKLCDEHALHFHKQCVISGCRRRSRTGKGGFCYRHGNAKTKKRLCLGECGRMVTRRRCSECTKKTSCKVCWEPGAIVTRGGVCVKCPLPARLKCVDPSCSNPRKNGNKGLCVTCAKKANVFYCRTPACNEKKKKARMHGPFCSDCTKPIN